MPSSALRLFRQGRQKCFSISPSGGAHAFDRTPRITTRIDRRRFIDKRYHGIRIGMRVGAITQEMAELHLRAEMQRIDLDLARRANPRPLFRDCAARYLAQSREKNSIETIRVHVGLTRRSQVGRGESAMLPQEGEETRCLRSCLSCKPRIAPFASLMKASQPA